MKSTKNIKIPVNLHRMDLSFCHRAETTSSNKAFSLIELMIVIAIIGILAAVALPQFQSMSDDAKKTKARSDLDTIAQAVTKFNALEGVPLRKLEQLAGKYMTNILELRDPWGNPYQINTGAGFVYSMGPDGLSHYLDRSNPPASRRDDIIVPYIGALQLVDATIAFNIGPSSTNPEDTMDELTLIFNKEVAFADLNDKLIEDGSEVVLSGSNIEMLNPGGQVFSWYSGNPSPSNLLNSSRPIFLPGQIIRMYSSPDDPRHIVLEIDSHQKSKLVGSYHHINTVPSLQKFFFEVGSFNESGQPDPEYLKMAIPARTACKIRIE